MIKLAAFDLDGTLLDTINDLLDSINDVAIKHGYKIINKDYFYSCIGNGQKFLINKAFNGIKESEYDQFLQEYLDSYESRLYSKTISFDGIKELLTKLNNINIKIGVLSNKKDNQVKSLIKHYFPEFDFEFVCGAECGNPLKPDKNAILNCLDGIHMIPSETIMIGDSFQDALTANNANIISAAVLWGYQSEEYIKQYSKPDYFVKNCDELFNLILSLNK